MTRQLNCNGICKNFKQYRQTSNISRTLEGNKIADHSDVIGASFVGAAPTTALRHSRLNPWFQWIGQKQLQDETSLLANICFICTTLNKALSYVIIQVGILCVFH